MPEQTRSQKEAADALDLLQRRTTFYVTDDNEQMAIMPKWLWEVVIAKFKAASLPAPK